MSQQRVAKSEAELDRTKRSLREAREEVQRAARDSADAVSKTQHKKLLVEVFIRCTESSVLRPFLDERSREDQASTSSLRAGFFGKSQFVIKKKSRGKPVSDRDC